MDNEGDLKRELYFLIGKFLKGGPCSATFQTLMTELNKHEILPKRLDWTGEEHPQDFETLEKRYSHINSEHLLKICQRINPLLDMEFKPKISHVPSLLGSGNYSVLRNKETKKRYFDLNDYMARRHGAPLLEPNTLKKHNIVKALLGREASGPMNRRQFLSGCQYKNIQLLGRTLGHLSAVYCVVFDSSSRYIITGADDLLVKVWHAISGRLLVTLRGASAEITDLALNYETTLLAAGSVDKIIRVWCLQTAYPVASLAIHTGLITGVNFCPIFTMGYRYLASTATDGSVAFWRYATDSDGTTSFESTPIQYLERMRPGCAQILCGSFSPGGHFLATGSADHNVRVYKMGGLEGPVRILEEEAHLDRVDSIQWSNMHLKFASGSKDGTCLIWRFENQQWKTLTLLMCTKLPGQKVTTEEQAKAKLRVTMLSWDKSDQWVITASSDNSIKVWDSITGQLVQQLLGHKAETYCVESHPIDSKILLTAGHDGKLILWNIITGEVIVSFQNGIDGQGFGAVFDVKWSPDGTMFAATDSHGHILTFGFGIPDKTRKVPREMFFHTDYRPLARNADNQVVDEQTQVPPHLMPPPFLVDIDGNPYPPYLQKLVPGREHCDIDQLVPNVVLGDEGRQEVIMEAVVDNNGEGSGLPSQQQRNRQASNVRSRVGMRRTGDIEGVRQSSGNWQRGDVSWTWNRGHICEPLEKSRVKEISLRVQAIAAIEMDEYKRELRKPLIPQHKVEAALPQREVRRRRRARHAYRTRASRTEQLEMEYDPNADEGAVDGVSSDSQDFTARESDMETSGSDGNDSDDSSEYSDWTADHGTSLAPPKRVAKRASRNRKRVTRFSGKQTAASSNRMAVSQDIPEEYRPLDWLAETVPKKAPYYPQMGDEVMFFQQGYNLYLNAVQNKKIYVVKPTQMSPWGKIKLKEPQLVKVIGIKYEIRPPRLCGLRLAVMTDENQVTQHSFDLKYHDITDVIDFFVLKQVYDTAMSRNWKVGDRFRSMIDDAWWCGKIVGKNKSAAFLCYRILWDNNENENLSPWDLEPLNARREPPTGQSLPVLPRELKNILYHADPEEWPMGNQDAACERIQRNLEDLMSMSIAEHFLAPVDLSVYPDYAYVVEYPIDLNTIKARFENRFYRRVTAAQFDARYIASNAEKFNEKGSDIVKNARIITDILLKIIGAVLPLDVPALCRQLQENYQSNDSANEGEEDREETSSPDQQPASRFGLRSHGRQTRSSRRASARQQAPFDWKNECKELLHLLWMSDDSEPFREPVDRLEHPDYDKIIDTPMDLSIIREELRGDNYDTPYAFCKDVRVMFQNAKNYTPNKRSRIYAMTVRLSSLAEEHMSRIMSAYKNASRPGGSGRGVVRCVKRRRPASSQEDEAATSDEVYQPTRRRGGKGGVKRSKRRRRQVADAENEGEQEEEEVENFDISQPSTSSAANRFSKVVQKSPKKVRPHQQQQKALGKYIAGRRRVKIEEETNGDDRDEDGEEEEEEGEEEEEEEEVKVERRSLRVRKHRNYAKMLESGSENETGEEKFRGRLERRSFRPRRRAAYKDIRNEDSDEDDEERKEGENEEEEEEEEEEVQQESYRRARRLVTSSDGEEEVATAWNNRRRTVRTNRNTRVVVETNSEEEEEEEGLRTRRTRSGRNAGVAALESTSDGEIQQSSRKFRRRPANRYVLRDTSSEEGSSFRNRRSARDTGTVSVVGRRLRRTKVCTYEEASDSMEEDVDIRVSVSSRGRIRKLTAKARAGFYRDV